MNGRSTAAIVMSSALSLSRNNSVSLETKVSASSMNGNRKAKDNQDPPLQSHGKLFARGSQQQHQRLPKDNIHPTQSRGKLLRPIKKRKANSKSLSPSQITRKRRRCLPISNSTSVSKAKQTSKASSIRIKKFFPGKLFRLVESYTASSHGKEDRILSWLSSNCQENDASEKSNKLLSLVIWDKGRFLQNQLVKSSFAFQSSFRSFERQLNSWGFKRDLELEEKLLKDCNRRERKQTNRLVPTKEGLRAFYHSCFQEKKPWLLQGVKRRPQRNRTNDTLESIVQSASGTNSSTGTTEARISASKPSAKPSSTETANTDSPTSTRSASPSDSSDSESSCFGSDDTEDENENENQPSSIRTDVVLPSGACLRINQRIPAWAIPAQQAAIRYLYQKHSKQSKTNKTCSSSSSEPSISNSTTLSDNKDNTIESSAAEIEFVFPRQAQAHPFATKQDVLGSLLQSLPRKSNGSPENDDTSDGDGRFCDASEDELSLTSQKETDDADREDSLVF